MTGPSSNVATPTIRLGNLAGAPGSRARLWPATAGQEREPRHVVLIKALLYALATSLYLWPLSSAPGIAAGVACGLLAMAIASAAHNLRLRLPAAILGGGTLLIGALLLGDRLLASRALAGWLGVGGSFIAADVVTFGIGGFCVVFLLRTLSYRARALSLLEVLFVAGSVATTLASHRNRMVNRPRFFSDWAWSLGIDPTTVLIAIGAGAMLLAVLLFLRRQPLLKLLTTLVLLALLGLLLHHFAEQRIESPRAADALGLTGKDQQRRGGQSPFKNDYQQQGPPQPVAVAILRDDYAPEDGLLYFRQRALSRYNGHHLVASEAMDHDVITAYPRSDPVEARGATQNPEHHLEVPTTMYLMVDHPQPPALTHAWRLTLVDNPNPKRFVAAYEVRSLVSSVPPKRLLGRRSIPDDWPPARRRHYTALPDDPRYRTLADIVVRRMDPRFSHDDMARAYAIKRHLEQRGFYTRKTTHISKRDPTGSFLFGSLRGYCVHFAHAAVYLFRSQGIAARVALGYAVQTHKRTGGSSILIMGDRAHAWPEIHLEGVGWVSFDIYPERPDMPPPQPVDYDLEKLLGELARNDPTGGLSPEGKPVRIPWGEIARGTALLLAALLLLAYLIKGTRRFGPALRREDRARCRATYLAVLDRLSDLGQPRRHGETRERHAARLRSLAPSLEPLTRAHLALAFGSPSAPPVSRFLELAAAVRRDLRRSIHPLRRLLGLLHPVGWLRTR